MHYLMVIPVPFYRVDEDTIACESAFAAHLEQLVPRIRVWGDRLLILSPVMTDNDYRSQADYLAHISCSSQGIDHVRAFDNSWRRARYALTWPFTVLPKVLKAVQGASVVHAGPSEDIFRPFEVLAIAFAVLLGRQTVFVKDIDGRYSADMLRATGKLSRKSYFLSKNVYDPWKSVQMRFASKYCTLLFLKGQSMVDDYGKGQTKVKNFYDTAHDASCVLLQSEVQEKCDNLKAQLDTLRLVYFGRFVEYKGIEDMIHVARLLHDRFTKNDQHVSLTLIGTGEQKKTLERIIGEYSLTDVVEIRQPIAYGPLLFQELYRYDFLLAAPQREDTPRSAFDAMACGLPVLAYGTYYYKDLERTTGAVKTATWNSVTDLANLAMIIKQNPTAHAELIRNGISFARENTQQAWLDRRHAWKLEYLGTPDSAS